MSLPKKTTGQTAKAKSRPTLQMIADELGISAMTVSKTLRGIGRIGEETRQLVRAKAEEMGYLSSKDRLFPPFVRASKRSEEHRLRLLCPTIGSVDRGDTIPYRNHMIAGLRQALPDGEGEILSRSFSCLEEMTAYLEQEKVHGVILSEPYPTRWLENIRRFAPAAYTVGYDFQPHVDAVFFNEARAAALIADTLQSHGHRNIGWLGLHDIHAPFHLPEHEFDHTQGVDWLAHTAHATRFASWLYLAREHKGLQRWSVSLIERDWRTTSLKDAVAKGIREILDTCPQTTAIVCMANAIAFEAIRQMTAAGLHVPKDISILSYGVEESGSMDGYDLCGVDMPMEKVGRVIPEVVQRRLAYPSGLAISIQLDSGWQAGNTLKKLPV